MAYRLLSRSRCFSLLLPTVLAVGQAAAQGVQYTGPFHYVGPPLGNCSTYGTPIPGTGARITMDIALNSDGTASGTASDGTHTVKSGTPNASLGCNTFFWNPDQTAVFYCGASGIDSSGQGFTLEAKSTWTPWWTPFSDSFGTGWSWCAGGEGWWSVEAPDFTISASPASQTIRAGKSAIYELDVTVVGGFSEPVQLTCGEAPAGGACAIEAAGPGKYTATVQTSPGNGKKATPKGTYILVFRGTTSDLAHDASVSLIVR
jgi:hypothetical protein